MTKVVFLGSRPLGKTALELLMSQKDAEIVGICVLETYKDSYWHSDPCDVPGLPRLSLDDLYDLDFDIGISVNYWNVIPNHLLTKPKLGFFNLHHSYNLTYRGLNISTHAILNARSRNQWYHGTTLHRMAEKLDAGEIVASKSCPILERDTALSLFTRVESISEEVMELWFPRLLTERIICAQPSNDYLYFSKSTLPSKDLTSVADNLELFDSVRAFTFPPYEPPYVMTDGRKRYLTTENNDNVSLYRSAGNNRNVYFL